MKQIIPYKHLNNLLQSEFSGVLGNLLKYSIILFIVAFLASIFVNEQWILILIWILFGISFLAYISLYIYFSLKKPDYLRSEKHQIMIQAIHILGDNERAFNPNMEHIANMMSPYNQLKDEKQNPLLK